jgi:hypothetical protein
VYTDDVSIHAADTLSQKENIMNLPSQKQPTKRLEARAVESYLPSLVPILLHELTDDLATLDAVIARLHQQIAALQTLQAEGYELVEPMLDDEGFARRPTGGHSERVKQAGLAWGARVQTIHIRRRLEAEDHPPSSVTLPDTV